MIELRPTRIILISFYCFLVGLFLFSLTANTIFGNKGTFDSFLWLPVAAAIVLAFISVAVGIGILYYNQLCWKILFFFLIIFIANVLSIILVALISLCFNISLLYIYSQDIHITPVMWFSFSTIFLFGLVVLYHLTRKEIIGYFGEMGELIDPF
jgi:hypothetical protein